MRRIAWMALALFALFEVAIRFAPANGMTYVATDAQGNVIASYATTDQRTVTFWRDGINGAPRTFGLGIACQVPVTYTPVYQTVTFTWYGIPVESAWNNAGGQSVLADGDPCQTLILSAGGLPDIFQRSVLSGSPSLPSLNSLGAP